MKYLRYALIAVALLAPSVANASKFWVLGAGTWDTSTQGHWATTSGGSPTGIAPPITGDTVVFDGNSGGGAVTVDSSVSGLTIASLTTSAFTGTIDFSAVTTLSLTSWSDTGSGTHSITFGSSAWAVTGINGSPLSLSGAGLTLSAASSTLTFAPASSASGARTFATNGQSFGTVAISGTNQNGWSTNITGAPTIATLTVSNGAILQFASGTTNITNALTLNGTSSAPIFLGINGASGAAIIKANGGASLSWAYLAHISFLGSSGAVNATNSFDGTGNNMNTGTISPPSGGGGTTAPCIING